MSRDYGKDMVMEPNSLKYNYIFFPLHGNVILYMGVRHWSTIPMYKIPKEKMIYNESTNTVLWLRKKIAVSA